MGARRRGVKLLLAKMARASELVLCAKTRYALADSPRRAPSFQLDELLTSWWTTQRFDSPSRSGDHRDESVACCDVVGVSRVCASGLAVLLRAKADALPGLIRS